MIKRLLLVVFGLASCCVVLWYMGVQQLFFPAPYLPAVNATSTAVNATSKELYGTVAKEDTGLHHSLGAMNLVQNEDGSRQLALTADAAFERIEDNHIILTQPFLTYFMQGDTPQEVKVKSLKGEIVENQHLFRFVENVVASQEGKMITGRLLVYNGLEKAMIFPEGGNFIGEDVLGKADKLTWHMGSRIIEAEGNVSVIFNAKTP